MSPKPVIHYFQHTEGGATHGFTYPLSKEIAKQVKAGLLVKVADAAGTDPDVEIARLRRQLDALAKASGIDLSSLETDGLADTTVSSGESADDVDQADEDDDLAPDPDAEDDDAGATHVCLECGDPVERKGKTGPWPSRHPECK